MLFDLSKLRRGRFFDENDCFFFEKTDLCYRIVQAGLRICLCGAVRFMRHLMPKGQGNQVQQN